MNILIAPDSFKDALPALEVCAAIKRGILTAHPNYNVRLFPLGDGGEGTAKILTWHCKGQWLKVKVHDPLMRQIEAGFGISVDKKTAFIEMVEASGLQLLKPQERNCLKTSTYGTGELIRVAIEEGAQEIVLCIGGSATNDVGIGMAAALGYQFLNDTGTIVLPVGEELGKIHSIEHPRVIDLSKIRFKILCDVDNPLCGPKGAAYTYARQKGADADALKLLEDGAKHFSTILKKHFYKDFAVQKGAGAAGGLGAGAMAFLNAELYSGIDYVLNATQFDQAIQKTDLIITGEGKIDKQTLHGKLIHGICKRAKEFDIPVIALCGALYADANQVQSIGLKQALSINPSYISLKEAIANTAFYLEKTAQNILTHL